MTVRRTALPLFLLVLCLLTVVPSSLGQTETATLSGLITDPQGKVVPGVAVEITNVDTNVNVHQTTNSAGLYVVVGLKPGRYRVSITKDGFRRIDLTDLVLNVQDVLSRNFQLQLGPVLASITVVAETGKVQTEPGVSTVVGRNFVENLPLNGRSFQSLITLSPGVVLTQAAGNGFEQGQFSVNGQRANANYFTIDGVSANVGMSAGFFPGQSGSGSLPALTALGGSNNLVSIDAIQEFRVQTSTYAPEFGRTPGGQVSIVTRSGTNEFHGAAFNYFRNDVLDATDWFANHAGLPKTALRQNDFGGVIGGPIVKNRTFFFFSYEGLRLRLPQVALNAEVPSLDARQAAPAGLQPFLNAYPRPNDANEGNGFAIFNSSFSDPSSLDAYSIRVDQVVNSKWRVFGRYSDSPSSTSQRGSSGSSLSGLNNLTTRTRVATLGASFVPTSRLANDLRLNYSRVTNNTNYTLDSFGGAVVPPASAVFPSFASSSNSAILMDLGGINTGFNLGSVANNLQRQFNIVDTVSLVSGKHLWRFGIDYRRLFPVVGIQNYSQTISFSGVGTPGAPPSPGSALSGTAAFVLVSAQKGPQVPVFNNWSLFAQDTWKASPRLTLTYGVRWDYNPPPKDANGHNPAVGIGLDDPSTMALAPFGASLWSAASHNFAPRVGVSYLLGQRSGLETVLRGGFGIFYDLGNGPAGNAFGFAFPFTASNQLANVAFPLAPSDAAPPAFTTTPTGFNFFFFFDPNLKTPRTYQWNVAVEQSLGKSQSVSATYVGALGRNLLREESLQTPNPSLPGIVFLTRNTATSDYHALQLQYRRTVSRGLQALASYSWSHSIDIASTDSSTQLPSGFLFPAQLDRGASDFDVRHALTGALTYDIPSPKGSRVVKAILQAWSADTNLTVRSATPVDVSYIDFTAAGPSFVLRPDTVAGVPLYLDDATAPRGRRINIAAFSIPSILRQGTLRRNALRGFPLFQMDFALGRQFHLTDRIGLQFKGEFFNIFNHPNFGNPSGNLGSAFPGLFIPFTDTFGISNSMLANSLGSGGALGGFNPSFQVGGPRSTQLSLKLQF